MLVHLLTALFLGCSQPPAPPPAPVAPPPAPAAPEVEGRLLPPPAPEGLEPVDVVGHGLRIRVFPPFQVARFPGLGGPDAEHDGLVLSWWNVADPEAGHGGGMLGLYNSTVVARPVPEEGAVVRQKSVSVGPRTVLRYQLGDEGSYLELPGTLSGLGGMLTIEPGPAEPHWSIEAGGQRTAIERQQLVHSADPATGAPFEISSQPHQPWGPWPEAASP